MKKTIWGLALLLGLASCSGNKSNNEMDAFINDLMGKMTLEEKLGQLNLPVTGDIVTGAAQSSNVAENIRAGRVGGLFNLKGAGRVAELQRIAVEESRLGIPLIFGMDVIHGYETVFPIPLGLSCTWDMEAIERSAQIAAQEATADGICWTFSPMVDICHDARWGRISEGSGEDPFLGSRIAEAMVRGYQHRPIWRSRGRPRLQHRRYEPLAHVQRVFPTLQGSLRCGCWQLYGQLQHRQWCAGNR